jgi:carbonic anhydrase
MAQKTYPALPNAEPTTLIIHCGDPRFQQAFARFPEEELGLRPGEWVALVPPGGIASFTEPLAFPKEFKVLKDAVAFYAEHFASIHTIVIVNHEDCGKYKAMQKIVPLFLGASNDLLGRQRNDLPKVAQTILGFLGRPVKVKQYMAKFANPEHTQVAIEAV